MKLVIDEHGKIGRGKTPYGVCYAHKIECFKSERLFQVNEHQKQRNLLN